MTNDTFSELEASYEAGGTEAALRQLADHLKEQHEFHQLFEVRKMQLRHQLRLPLMYSESGDDLDQATQNKLEEGLVEACREVGRAFLQAGNVREGWLYLRPVGDRESALQQLGQIEATEENLEEMIEVLLHEGLDVERGYGLVLSHYGTCNAITTYDSALHGRSKTERSVAAAALLKHVHQELTESVFAHIEQEQGHRPSGALGEVVRRSDWLWDNGAYHIDATHLASAVRIARELTEPALLPLAWELTQYGQRLDPQLQYPGDEPFAELYLAHARFFEAQMGRNVEEALAYFQQQARATEPYEMGTMPIEVFIELLSRIGRHDDAIAATLELIPHGTHTTGYAPTLLELSERAGNYERLKSACRERNEVLGFALGLLQASTR